jgi:hypothetical protein
MFDDLSNEQLQDELAAQAAHVDAGLCRLLELVAECKRRFQVGGDGTTFAQWLAFRCSLLPRQAREHERIADRLDELPEIHGAFSRGELSYGKVSTLTTVAEPATEKHLLELAEGLTASQLQRAAGAYREVTKEDAAQQQDEEFLHYFWKDDGSLAMRASLAPDGGALVVQALTASREALRAERETDIPVSNADALVAIADLALARPEGERSGSERYQVVVHVDAQTLANEGDGLCELAEGPALAAETARRLSCDASIVELLERDGEPLSVGRMRRTVSTPLRRALAARDRGCRFPGCENRRFVHAHHAQHWSQGGETSLTNLISLCARHHRLVHERGYSVRLGDDGEPQFTNEYGVAMPNVPRLPPPSSAAALPDRHRRAGIEIDAKTCRNGTGDRMDLGLAVDAFLSIDRRANKAPPE